MARRAAASVVAEAKIQVLEKFREAIEKDFWQTIRQLRKGKQSLAQAGYSRGGELLTRTRDIVGRWKELGARTSWGSSK